MNHFEKKKKIIKNVIDGEKVVIIDTEEEYAQLAKTCGGKVITINTEKAGFINPFSIATESVPTIEEKEIELRKLLDYSDYGHEYARQRLTDMSFLDAEPIWKERAIIILQEYANKLGRRN